MENEVEKIEEPIKLDTVEDRIKLSQELNSGSFEAFSKQIEQWASKFTPEYMEQLSKDSYADDREYPENFSNWFPHIVDTGYFRCAKVISNQIFTYEETKVFRKTDVYNEVDWKALNDILKPTLDKMEPYKMYSIKNGCFSNKFDFKTCIANKNNLAEQLWKINYKSAELDTGGYTELVVRELIPCDKLEVPTIYNGMPLREEIRVFYNIDTHSIEYMEDYWKYKYCSPYMPNKADKIVFDWFHNKLKTRKVQHRELLKQLEDIIWNNIDTLKFDETLKGIWSIDFMYVPDGPYKGIWLIDMARGYRSAYWNPDKLSVRTQIKLREELKNEE
jgi:hypothetical protein